MVVIWSAFNIFQATQFVLAITLSSSAYTHLFLWLRRSDLPKSSFNWGQQYQDEDGEASKESLQSFADRLPRAAFALHTFIGSLACFGLIVVGSCHGTSLGGFLQFGIWVPYSFLRYTRTKADVKLLDQSNATICGIIH
jgi:hypothetical protein